MSFSGADQIAQALADLEVEHAFGIVSIHNMPIFDAINRLGKTRIIDVRHEQAGTHAADGYARASGNIGVMIASTGPGTSNTVTGLYEAMYASSRVLLITGQAETAFYGKGVGYVHEAEQQVPMLATVCRRVESPRNVSQIIPSLHAVVSDMCSGRAAPGAIEIPVDLQYQAGDAEAVQRAEFSKLAGGVALQPEYLADPLQLEAMATALQGASRRLIIAGGGVIAANAGATLTALAERLDAPVLTTVDGRGAISEEHPLALGNYYDSAGMRQAIANADVTLALGTRFAVGVDGRAASNRPPGLLLQVDIDPKMIGRTHDADLGLVADAGSALNGLLAKLEDAVPNDAQFLDAVQTARDGVRGAMRKRLGGDYARMMDAMRNALPDDGLWVRDTTIAAYNFGNQLFPVRRARTSINPSSGAIGPGLPLAIGATIATGQRTLLLHGDGGFMFHATELATAAQYQIPLTVVVMNDAGYGVLRWLQDSRFGRINETDLGQVDFAMMAQSMGVPGQQVQSVDAFESALALAMRTAGPYLIDVDMASFAPMELSIMPKKKNP
ncbi:MAG: thiamine pyrophosphate-binding protein [Pseudomonadales bacterium]